MTSRGDMKDARFERSTLDGHMFDRVEAAGLALIACRLLATSFGRVKMSTGSLVGSVVVGGRINGCDLSDADLRGADLSQTQLSNGHGSNVFTGAKYNAQTKFPEGFDPEAEGMVRVADFTPEEEAELMWKEPGATTAEAPESGAEEGFDRSKLPTVKGLFVPEEAKSALDAGVEKLAARVNGATWPPAGYEGAEKDGELALKLQELLKPANEGSSVDSDYYAFVLAPDAEMPDAEDAINALVDVRLQETAHLLGVDVESFELDDEGDDEDEDEDEMNDDESSLEESSRTVLLHPDADELERQSKTWWKEFYSKEEYEARLAASQLMFKELSDVDMDNFPYGAAWNHAIYSGTSKSGATVGVMAVRFDEDDENPERLDQSSSSEKN